MKTLTLITYRTLDAVEVEVSDDAGCVLCQNPAIGGMVFPEPYQLDENTEIHGNALLCREHIDHLNIDARPI